jgi:hypothetical protein
VQLLAYIQTRIRSQTGFDIELVFSQSAEDYERNVDVLFGTDESGHPADDYSPRRSEVLTLRAEPLLMRCLDALADEFEVPRGDIVRRLLHVSLADLHGEFAEVHEQQELEFGGVGGSAPDDSLFHDDTPEVEQSSSAKTALSSSHPSAKQIGKVASC